MSQKPPTSEPPGRRLLDVLGRRGKPPESKRAQRNPESNEERRKRVKQLVHKALGDERGTTFLSLLRDDADGQLATDEVWKMLFQLSTSPDEGKDENDRREALKRALLRLIAKFGTLPVGPVFTEAIHICPDPGRHPQVDLKPTHSESKDPKVQARTQRFIANILQQGDGTDPVSALPNDVSGQDAIDESWNVLTGGNLPGNERDKIRRLCLKLVLGLGTIPAAMQLQDVEYEEKDLLGTGSFSDVFRGRSRGAVVAVKRLREFTTMTGAQRRDVLKSLHREAFLWKLLDHPYILPLFGVSSAGRRERVLTLVSPLAANGGIRDYVRKLQSDSKLPESGPEFTKHICHLLHQISVGLVYLHGQGIVHGDLHCGNILINAAGDVQLTDFGLALIADATSYNYASVHGGGALFTRAPELLDPEAETTRQTTACDVYAFAFVCIELFTGRRAFPNDLEIQILGFIMNGRRPERPHQLEDDVTHDLMWSLIVACWATLPEWRPISSYVSGVMQRIVDYTNGKVPLFASQEIWRLDPAACSRGKVAAGPNIITTHDYLVHLHDSTIDVYSVATGEMLHRLDYGRKMNTVRAVCTKRIMVITHATATQIWSLVTGKCVYIFEGGGSYGLSITNPDVFDAEDLGMPRGSNPTRTPLIVITEKRSLVVLTFPPSLHQLGDSEPKVVPLEESPFLKHRHHHSFPEIRSRGQTSSKNRRFVAQENIAVVAQSADLEVWDVVVGERKWAIRGDRDSLAYTDVDSVSVNVHRGIVAASFSTSGQSRETSVRMWNLHTGEILHDLNTDHLVLTMCQQSIPSLLSLTAEYSFTLWEPWSSPPIRPLLLPRTPFHKQREYPLFVHGCDYAVWAGDDGIDVVNIRSGITMGTLAIDDGFEVSSLHLRGQICVAALCSSSCPPKVVVWKFGAGSDAGLEAEPRGFDWSTMKAFF